MQQSDHLASVLLGASDVPTSIYGHVHLCIWCPHVHMDSDSPYLTLLQRCHPLFCIIFCRLQLATEERIVVWSYIWTKGKVNDIICLVSTCDIICLQLWKNCRKYNNNSECKILKWQDVLGKSNKLANWDDDSSKHLLTTISFLLRLAYKRDNQH